MLAFFLPGAERISRAGAAYRTGCLKTEPTHGHNAYPACRLHGTVLALGLALR